MVQYQVKDVNEHASFLEMLDVLNEQLAERGKEPVAFEHDCRERICTAPAASWSTARRTARCRPPPSASSHMRHFEDGDACASEPKRS